MTPGSAPRRLRRRTWLLAAAAAVLVIAAAVTVLVIRLAGGSTIDTSGVTEVQITVFQSIPPPDTIEVTLQSDSSVAAFDALLQSHGIGVNGSSTENLLPGCTGGVETTIVLTRSGGGSTTLSDYACGGSSGSNLNGDVSGFISAVDSGYLDCPGRGWGTQSVGSCPGT